MQWIIQLCDYGQCTTLYQINALENYKIVAHFPTESFPLIPIACTANISMIRFTIPPTLTSVVVSSCTLGTSRAALILYTTIIIIIIIARAIIHLRCLHRATRLRLCLLPRYMVKGISCLLPDGVPTMFCAPSFQIQPSKLIPARTEVGQPSRTSGLKGGTHKWDMQKKTAITSKSIRPPAREHSHRDRFD